MTTESTSVVWIPIPDGTEPPGPEDEYYKTYVFFHYFFRILGFFLFLAGIFLFVRFLYFSGLIPANIGNIVAGPPAPATYRPPPPPPSVGNMSHCFSSQTFSRKYFILVRSLRLQQPVGQPITSYSSPSSRHSLTPLTLQCWCSLQSVITSY